MLAYFLHDCISHAIVQNPGYDPGFCALQAHTFTRLVCSALHR